MDVVDQDVVVETVVVAVVDPTVVVARTTRRNGMLIYMTARLSSNPPSLNQGAHAKANSCRSVYPLQGIRCHQGL